MAAVPPARRNALAPAAAMEINNAQSPSRSRAFVPVISELAMPYSALLLYFPFDLVREVAHELSGNVIELFARGPADGGGIGIANAPRKPRTLLYNLDGRHTPRLLQMLCTELRHKQSAADLIVVSAASVQLIEPMSLTINRLELDLDAACSDVRPRFAWQLAFKTLERMRAGG